MKEKLMNGLMGFAMFLQNQRHFRAIKNAFSALLPIIIVGSFCTLFSNVVCNTNPGYFSLANVPGMSWLENLGPLFTSANYGTMNFIAIGLVIAAVVAIAAILVLKARSGKEQAKAE